MPLKTSKKSLPLFIRDLGPCGIFRDAGDLSTTKRKGWTTPIDLKAPGENLRLILFRDLPAANAFSAGLDFGGPGDGVSWIVTKLHQSTAKKLGFSYAILAHNDDSEDKIVTVSEYTDVAAK